MDGGSNPSLSVARQAHTTRWDDWLWEIFTALMAALLVLHVFDLFGLGLSPLVQQSFEATLAAEKFGLLGGVGLIGPEFLGVLASRMFAYLEIIYLAVWGIYTVLRNHRLQLVRIVRLAIVVVVVVVALSAWVEAKSDPSAARPLPVMHAKFYAVAAHDVVLYRNSDGKPLCTLPVGTRLRSLQGTVQPEAFGPNDLAVQAETLTCGGWSISMVFPLGVIRAGDFKKLGPA